jgi:hypothetical protein
VADYRPADDEYYEFERSSLLAQGDIFRDVPLAYPTTLAEVDAEEHDERGEKWLSAGKRRFISGPLDFGFAMLVTPTCAMSAQGAPGYAHPVRTLVVVRLLAGVVDLGFVTEQQADDLRRRDMFNNYMYLPPTPNGEIGESVALLYYPVTLHHDFIEGNRVTQLALPGAQQLQRKLGIFYAGFEVDRHEFDPPMD